MLSYTDLEQVVVNSGLWTGERRQTHGFLLSPDVFELSAAQAEELEAIGKALRDVLAGFGRIMAILSNPKLWHGQTWGNVSSILRTGVPKFYTGLEAMEPGRIPGICKVDILLTDAGLKICEVDAHNAHGLGYSTLGRRFRELVRPEAKGFPSVANSIAQQMQKAGKDELLFSYADQERFYLPEFEIFGQEMIRNGIEMRFVNELAVRIDQLEGRLLTFFPPMYKRADLVAKFSSLYREGKVGFVIPPKPFLGSKALLALIRNEDGDAELEAIMRAFVPARSIEVLRGYIPRTYLVGKKTQVPSGKWVLKECVSSGMKGVVFSDQPEFGKAFEAAKTMNGRFVLQEESANEKHAFRYWNGIQDGAPEEAKDWQVRLTVHFAPGQVADAMVTARRDKAVHGAKDAIQLGTSIV